MLIFVGTLIYDVVFVFGSDVMMTVAVGFESPMKILFPVEGGLAMLGILDVIIPGILVTFCMRCDYIRYMIAKSKESKKAIKSQEELLEELDDDIKFNEFPVDRYYFVCSLISYNFGLVSCSFAMSVYNTP